MGSLYLNSLSPEQKTTLKNKLHSMQEGLCFICSKPIELKLQIDYTDIDHVIPINTGGRDDESNFALTHQSCNRSKQDANLEVARVLHRFTELRDALQHENRGPNLDDVLKSKGGSQHELSLMRENDQIRYTFSESGDNTIRSAPIYRDQLSGMEYFFAELPIEYLYHDDKINPRSIGQNIAKLVKEFHLKRPQLHISLAWIELSNNERRQVRVFDGQHKAAAQILLGSRRLPVRVFVNPDIDILLTTNTNAGTTLRQVAFDKSVQRRLGGALYIDRIERFQREKGYSSDYLGFSERDLVKYFKGESREVRRYIIDSVRDGITHHPDNKLRDFIDFGGRSTERPLSYSSIEKTFFSFFIYSDVLDTPLDYRMEDDENPRELEKRQIVRLMNIIAEEMFVDKFNRDIGTSRIESKIQKKDADFPMEHLRAFRMSKEEILYNWVKYVEQIIKSYFFWEGKPVDEKKLFQYPFPEALWERIRLFVANLSNLPVWVNYELSSTIFGGKQNYEFWQTIFETGKSPQGTQVLGKPLNLIDMIKE